MNSIETKITNGGRIMIPAEILKKLGLQTLVRKYVRKRRSLVSELSCERRKEAADE